MDFSSVRLVASDMDGTLLNTKHELSPDFFTIFNRMRSKEILFSAASGRQYQNLYNCFPGIQDEIIFIAENGSYVMHQGKELHIQPMDRDLTRDLLKRIKKLPNVLAILCGKKSAYIDNDDPAFVGRLSMYYDEYAIVDNLVNVDDDEFLKIAICDLSGAEQNSYPHFLEYQHDLQIKVSGNVWLDLSHKLAHKGKALDVVQKKFGIGCEHTMVFGDYLNDVEMMGEAHFSFAMENAHPEVKNVARFTTHSNDNRGVLSILEQL
ncbi:Cof-type HAD-IIB family hydrolase [Fulvivirgaceae bacterium PWU5]|uniref:Cof-type HAD-IIB family hydrolase n=1 Tax=Dawidia cretensis TaxID=2782350 RepID=A0AAP2E0E9_9BACT|nr:HAD family hydrolase [Dawidia cretensis]MBT1710686.1 Cof-type HAD-IIB family hydrolase [Dawidia cretensis]